MTKKEQFKSDYIKPFLELDKGAGKIYLGFETVHHKYLQPEKRHTNEQIASSVHAQFNMLANNYISEFSRFLREIWTGGSKLPKVKILEDKPCVVRAIDGGLKVSSSK